MPDVSLELESIHRWLSKIAYPSDFQKQQLKLSVFESQPLADSEQEISIELIDSVIASLHALILKAKNNRKNILIQKLATNTVCNSKQHFGVSLSDLIGNGDICTETKLELQWRRNGEIVEGKVLKNGHIEVLTNSGWVEYKSISTAATEIAGHALNGWKHWKMIDSDGTRIPLEKVRDRHLKMTPTAQIRVNDLFDFKHKILKPSNTDNVLEDDIKI